MDKETLLKQFQETQQQDLDFINKSFEKALKSNCINLEAYDKNEAILMKILKYAIYKELADSYQPYSEPILRKFKKEASNIRIFL